MSDYTPTTEEVRMAYEIDPENPFFSSAAEWTGDEFDRWLAEVKAQAWKEGFSDCLAFMSLDNPDFERASKHYDRVTK